jgi:hypothetical protein
VAENPGVAPPDTDTDVGALRYLIPDTVYVPLATPIAGQGSYDWFSDAALEVFLDQADDDLDIAKVTAWAQIADYYASEAVSVTTDDLRVDLTKRAQFWRDKVTAAQVALGGDVFALATLGSGTCEHAELAGWYYGYCSCN